MPIRTTKRLESGLLGPPAIRAGRSAAEGRSITIVTAIAAALAALMPVALMSAATAFAQTEDSWQILAPVGSGPSARHEADYVRAADKLFLIGGRDTRDVDEYDPVTNAWITHGPPTNEAGTVLAYHHLQAVEFGGRAYVVCAFRGGYPTEVGVSNVYSFDPASPADWATELEIPEARRRGAAGAALYGGKIYVVGGNTLGHNSGWVPWFDVYDPIAATWTPLADAPRSRDHHRVSVINGKLYVLAGRRSSADTGDVKANTIAEVDVYDFGTQQWETLPALSNIPTERAGVAVIRHGRELVVIGGESPSGDHDDVEAFDVLSEHWRVLPSLNVARNAPGAAAYANTLYVVAGRYVKTEQSSQEVLDLVPLPLASTTTTTTTTTSTTTITTSTTLPGCTTNADCDDAIFCNGAEICVGGECRAGIDPCASMETCNEDIDVCQPCGDVTLAGSVECFTQRRCTVDVVLDSGALSVSEVAGRLTSTSPIECGSTCSNGAASPNGQCLADAPTCTFIVADSDPPIDAFAVGMVGGGTVARLDLECTQDVTGGQLCVSETSLMLTDSSAAPGCGDGCVPFQCRSCLAGDCNQASGLESADPLCTVLCAIGEPPARADCACAADCNCIAGVEASDPICVVLRQLGLFTPDTCANGSGGLLVYGSPEDSSATKERPVRASLSTPRIGDSGRATYFIALRGPGAKGVAGMQVTLRSGGPVGRITIARRLRRRGFSVHIHRTSASEAVALISPPLVDGEIAAMYRGAAMRVKLADGAHPLMIGDVQLASTLGRPVIPQTIESQVD